MKNSRIKKLKFIEWRRPELRKELGIVQQNRVSINNSICTYETRIRVTITLTLETILTLWSLETRSNKIINTLIDY